MKQHLSEEQLADLILEESSAPASQSSRDHLAQCSDCAAEVGRLRAALSGVHQQATRAAERPAAFWREQRRQMGARLVPGALFETRWFAWSAAMAAVLLLAVALSQRVPSAPPAAQAQPDPDHQLLVEVERSLRRDVPLALEPAALIAQELHSAAGKKSSP